MMKIFVYKINFVSLNQLKKRFPCDGWFCPLKAVP